MAGYEIFYNAKIAEQKGPGRAFLAFCKYFYCFQQISWIQFIGNPHKSLFLSPMLTYFTKKSLLDENLLQFHCQEPGIEHNGKK